MYDPENFKDPELFQPERYILIWFFWLNHGCNLHSLFRFINQERKFVNSEKVVPFGIGKRYCLGRSLAEKEYFLFFSGILQQFKLENVPGSKPPNYSIDGGEGTSGGSLIRAPPQFEIVLKSRIWNKSWIWLTFSQLEFLTKLQTDDTFLVTYFFWYWQNSTCFCQQGLLCISLENVQTCYSEKPVHIEVFMQIKTPFSCLETIAGRNIYYKK